MDITFSAANTAGLNNPGTEIITLVKDGSGNFINPPSYDKMRAYLHSGEVPMLFVTTEGGETGSLYQLDGYSETENKIRFTGGKTAIEFSAGSAAPVVSDVGSGGGVTTLHINVTAVNKETMEATFTADKTPAEMQLAAGIGPVWCVVTIEAGVLSEVGVPSETAIVIGAPPAWRGGPLAFGESIEAEHGVDGYNKAGYLVIQKEETTWSLDLTQFGG